MQGYRDRYVLAHLDTEAHDVPGLPHAAIEMIKEKFKTLTSQVQDQQTSADGSTTKLLIQLQVYFFCLCISSALLNYAINNVSYKQPRIA